VNSITRRLISLVPIPLLGANASRVPIEGREDKGELRGGEDKRELGGGEDKGGLRGGEDKGELEGG